MQQSKDRLNIAIVGGGTAGWLTANFLARQLPLSAGLSVEITLIEASDIPTVGVGEATIPSLRETLAACGIDEFEFLRSCDATFKHGIEFIQWREDPTKAKGESYFHPFGAPLKVGPLNPVRQWSSMQPKSRGAFADVFSVQPEMAHIGQAPKHTKDALYDGALAYAYHLDAGKLAEMLKQRSRGKTVRQIIAKVERVETSLNDKIERLHLDNGAEIAADLFIDCTGFAARLINFNKTNLFKSKSSELFVDRAVTTRIAHNGISDINGYTRCTAQTSGWIWDIALRERRGIGHVYSSRHMDDDDARQTLADYVGISASEIETRKLDMRIGYHAQQWRGNCVAIGLSSGFLEPLESTGIYLIEMANWALIELLPRYLSGANPQSHYDRVMKNHYENIADFLKLHYCISSRRDSPFWVDNSNPETISKTLQANLENWQESPPSIYDFNRTTQCFSATNYQFVLYGMGWRGHKEPRQITPETKSLMNDLAVRRQRLKQYVLRDTQSNTDFFKSI